MRSLHSITESLPRAVAGPVSETLEQLRPLCLSLLDKAAALGYSLIRNHGFLDGNKRVAHAAMEVFLVLNGLEIRASVDEQERFMLSLAAGEISREELANWLRTNTTAVE